VLVHIATDVWLGSKVVHLVGWLRGCGGCSQILIVGLFVERMLSSLLLVEVTRRIIFTSRCLLILVSQVEIGHKIWHF